MKFLIATALLCLGLGGDSNPIIFNNTNGNTVYNEPLEETWFEIKEPSVVTGVFTYHWNHKRGADPTTIEIKSENGRTMGEWDSKGFEASLGVKNGNHYIEPELFLQPGRYQIVDHSSTTWSWNEASGGQGFAIVHAYIVD
jgi:hypothetical protein